MSSSGPRSARGIFITVDGPNGVGKSSAIAVLRTLLRARRVASHFTTEPTNSALGRFIRRSHGNIRGIALACLVAADRYHHLATEVEPALARGLVVISDRYIESSLVLQRLDGVDQQIIWDLNRFVRRPDLSVVLSATSRAITSRLTKRGRSSRFELRRDSTAAELRLYRQVGAFLSRRGFKTHVLDCSDSTIEQSAQALFSLVVGLRIGALSPHGRGLGHAR